MNLRLVANTAYDSILALAYPQACAVCGGGVESRALGVACAKCWNRTEIFTGDETICWKCGLPSLGSVCEAKREEVRCRRCDADHFFAARACGSYEGALRATILALKHSPNVSAHLLDLLVETRRRPPLNQSTRIIPVPLHPEREKVRGFNQAATIGSALSVACRLPFDDVSLIRLRHTERHRAGMDGKDRRATVADAFQVSYPALVAGERILLVDDVFTTGATASSCAKVLVTAGASSVFVLTIARPLRNYEHRKH
ncbi:MAG TPA: ComF family protein [Pyrinomonadaceae bacterium]|nr:ComF family protein [Pyrinomonadaceae bacterium]